MGGCFPPSRPTPILKCQRSCLCNHTDCTHHPPGCSPLTAHSSLFLGPVLLPTNAPTLRHTARCQLSLRKKPVTNSGYAFGTLGSHNRGEIWIAQAKRDGGRPQGRAPPGVRRPKENPPSPGGEGRVRASLSSGRGSHDDCNGAGPFHETRKSFHRHR